MKNIISQIKKNKYLFIGEIHGTSEIPKKVIGLIKNLAKTNKIVFCLELPKQIEQELNEFLKKKVTKDKLLSSPYLEDALSDNRFNHNIVSMYMELNKENIKIKCLEDYYLKDITKRDEIMANNLKEIIEKEKADLFIIYAGNMHVLDKSIKIGNFIVNPIKIYLNKDIINKSLTIQFNEGNHESIIFDKNRKTFTWNLRIRNIITNKFELFKQKKE